MGLTIVQGVPATASVAGAVMAKVASDTCSSDDIDAFSRAGACSSSRNSSMDRVSWLVTSTGGVREGIIGTALERRELLITHLSIFCC